MSGPAAHDLFHAVMGRTLSMTLVSFRLPCFCPLSSELSSSQWGHKCLVPKEMHICLPSALGQQANIQLSATETPGVLPGRLLRRHCCFSLYPHCSLVPQHRSKEGRPCPGQVTERWALVPRGGQLFILHQQLRPDSGLPPLMPLTRVSRGSTGAGHTRSLSPCAPLGQHPCALTLILIPAGTGSRCLPCCGLGLS